MSHSQNIIGTRCGKLIVGERALTRADSDDVYHHVTCDCGNTKLIRLKHLVNRKVKSCGCSRYANIRASSYSYLYTRYRLRAKICNVGFDLTMDEFVKFIQRPCFYCGVIGSNQLSRKTKRKGSKLIVDTFSYNGIDRLDPKLGYVLGNMETCCWRCNFAKSDMTSTEFLDLVQRIYANLNLGAE